jgi:hypothetical protein
VKRRSFLRACGAGAAGLAAGACRGWPSPYPFSGRVVGASSHLGHLLKGDHWPRPRAERRVPVVIVGGGLAGLSAGWKLQKAGFDDFEILELEGEAGGNARFGQNAVSAFPWGAHYVPFPTRESRAVRELLHELGAITGYDAAGRPIFEETYVCNAPEERLYIHGKWQEGLLPLTAASRDDLAQFDRFQEIVAGYRDFRDPAGRPGFAIPMEESSRDAGLLALDHLSMRDFLLEHELDSKPLHWYVDYCCRDDYGSHAGDVSAWAGVHYFASREGESATPSETTLLTWPEGLGWIARRLRGTLARHIGTDSLVFRIDEAAGGRVFVDAYRPADGSAVRLVADDLVLACPSFLARFLVPGLERPLATSLAAFEYAPWMVANLTLDAFPLQRAGVPIAWDNVIYDSPSLGYVAATHQSLQSRPRATVLTFYHVVAGRPTADRRRELASARWAGWVDFILRDLSRPHPEIRGLVANLDMMLWGHAMICPRPGFMWGEARQRVAGHRGRILFANSDVSGFSIFEEAQYRGVFAAEEILRRRNVAFTTSL